MFGLSNLTDRYPIHRLSVNYTLDTLMFLHNKLKDTEAFESIRSSIFGRLYDLPVGLCPVSCKLIHGLLTRQFVTQVGVVDNVCWILIGFFPRVALWSDVGYGLRIQKHT